MSGRDRIMIFSSRANLVLIKQRIASAEKGLSLLKRKRDVLEIHVRQLSAELRQVREKQNAVVQDAIFSLAKARFLCTDFKPASLMTPTEPEVYVNLKYTKIVGINVPSLEVTMKPFKTLILTGLANGKQQVQVVREKFRESIKVLVAVASLQYSISVMSEAVKNNNMRVNGLEHVVLPRYQNTVEYIREQLDELEREEFYRLKRSQAKQIKKKLDFIKACRRPEKEIEVVFPAFDFSDTNLETPLDEILAAKPGDFMQGRRRTVSKIYNKTIIMEKDDEKPLQLDVKLAETPQRQSPDLKVEKVVTSSSSSESDSSE